MKSICWCFFESLADEAQIIVENLNVSIKIIIYVYNSPSFFIRWLKVKTIKYSTQDSKHQVGDRNLHATPGTTFPVCSKPLDQLLMKRKGQPVILLFFKHRYCYKWQMKTSKAGGAERGRVTLAQGQPLVIMGRERPKVLMTDFNPLPLLCASIFQSVWIMGV